ncbi:MAG: TolC family protein [Chlamydiales bacterium]|nr:TolC family protein [Chlamydiales bacterium]
MQPEDFKYVEQEDPLSLAEVIDIALLNNPGTRSTWANTRLAASIYGRTLAGDFILADGSGTGTRFRQALFTGPSRSIVYSILSSGNANFSYLVFDFGRTRNTSKAALESLYNADWTHNREIQTIMQTVMSDYYNYLYEVEKLAAGRADVLDAQVTLESVLTKQGVLEFGLLLLKSSGESQMIHRMQDDHPFHQKHHQIVEEMQLCYKLGSYLRLFLRCTI